MNPYANPYLPVFAANRPRMNDGGIQTPVVQPLNVGGSVYSQIHPVNGFEGADNYAKTLAAGSSEIVSESDTSLARIYVVAKDANGQTFVQGMNVVPIERPKPVTMDDLNAKMSELLERMNKLEAEKEKGNSYDAKPNNGYVAKSSKQSYDARTSANSRNVQGGQESAGNYASASTNGG